MVDVLVAVFSFSTPFPAFTALSGGWAADNQHFEPPLGIDLNKNVFIWNWWNADAVNFIA